MNRRELLKTGAAAAVAAGAAGEGWSQASGSANHYYELRTYELRNDLKPARVGEFFERHFMPAMKRLGIGPVGCFSVISGQLSPALIVLIDHPSLAAMQTAHERMSADKEIAAAWKQFETAELPYTRYESKLLRAFDAHPKIEIPPADEKRPARIFEMRTYESRNAFSLRDKITMFNQEEIKIFRDCGFAPVFFGEGVIGERLPHLTYMVGFDNMAAREKAWDTFRSNPDWARVRVKPGWTDAEAVSNSHTSFLRPTAYSQIR